tara:strand:- start:1036 stop:1560 length:525 start_codon:yes stop_codon:yes gene_type:complete
MPFHKGQVSPKAIDLVGHRYNKIEILEKFGVENGRGVWVGICDCGSLKTYSTGDLRGGRLVSCGCHKSANTAQRNRDNLLHGMTGTPTYITWFDMKQRCRYKKDSNYHLYGGRGILFCEEWNDFRNFLRDMGVRPENKTIDRINPYKGYFKENCRWATPTEQANNKRIHYDVSQ